MSSNKSKPNLRIYFKLSYTVLKIGTCPHTNGFILFSVKLFTCHVNFFELVMFFQIENPTESYVVLYVFKIVFDRGIVLILSNASILSKY